MLIEEQKIDYVITKKLAQSNSVHWNIATSQDSRFLKTKGKIEANFIDILFQKYIQKLQSQATLDPQIYTLLMEIAHSIKPPSYFLAPKLIRQFFQPDIT